MITAEKLIANFYPVDRLSGGIYRCADEFPRKTIYSYFLLCDAPGFSPFVVIENDSDDDFARVVLDTIGCSTVTSLTKVTLEVNRHGFTHLLLVPDRYHAELKGRLDTDRPTTILCIPIFDSEFSGTETVEEFFELRRNVVPTYNLTRGVYPKITFRFDNPKTRGSTGDDYVFARFDLVTRELQNLIGVPNGFLEIINYHGSVVEVVFDRNDQFIWIPDRDDAKREQLFKDSVEVRLWAFLNGR